MGEMLRQLHEDKILLQFQPSYSEITEMLQKHGLFVDNDVHYFLSPEIRHGVLSNIGERRLESAILETAIYDIIRPLSGSKHNKQKVGFNQKNALAWVFSKDQNYTFSFENICLDLKIDPEYTRSLLKKFLKNNYNKVVKANQPSLFHKNKVVYTHVISAKKPSSLPSPKRKKRLVA